MALGYPSRNIGAQPAGLRTWRICSDQLDPEDIARVAEDAPDEPPGTRPRSQGLRPFSSPANAYVQRFIRAHVS
jgi:hypothetical protein